jgi:hypothetical protein
LGAPLLPFASVTRSVPESHEEVRKISPCAAALRAKLSWLIRFGAIPDALCSWIFRCKPLICNARSLVRLEKFSREIKANSMSLNQLLRRKSESRPISPGSVGAQPRCLRFFGADPPFNDASSFGNDRQAIEIAGRGFWPFFPNAP